MTRYILDIEPIKSERDYGRVLKEIDALVDAGPDTAEGDRLDVLATSAVAWEEKYRAIEPPEPGPMMNAV